MQMNTTFAYTYSPFDDKEIYSNNNYEIPIELRNIDNEPITPYTWKVIQIKLVEPDSSILITTLKRPNWWIKHNKADKVGNRFNIFISDMNVAGEAEVLKIQGQQIDTRIETHKAEVNYKFRPVTGKFERTSSDVWTYYFENGDTIGCTSNHPYYSQDRLEYVPIGEINIGENIKLAGEKLEALAAKAVQQKKEIKGFGVKVQRAKGNPAGEIDILTDHELIEVKKSLSDVKINQIDKYANFENADFMNLNAKKVILYIEDAATNPNHPTLQTIQAMSNTYGIEVKIIIGSLTNLKNALK